MDIPSRVGSFDSEVFLHVFGDSRGFRSRLTWTDMGSKKGELHLHLTIKHRGGDAGVLYRSDDANLVLS